VDGQSEIAISLGGFEVGCVTLTHCNTLQRTEHTAAHCNMLQRTETRCNMLTHRGDDFFGGGCRTLQRRPLLNCADLYFLECGMDTLQHVATHLHCNTLQHVATHLPLTLSRMRHGHTATHCNTLQHTATRCKLLKHTANHCNTPLHAATRCNTLQHAATHVLITLSCMRHS